MTSGASSLHPGDADQLWDHCASVGPSATLEAIPMTPDALTETVENISSNGLLCPAA